MDTMDSSFDDFADMAGLQISMLDCAEKRALLCAIAAINPSAFLDGLAKLPAWV